MKAVLISMQADPNYLIESHKKTLEMRKTRPIIAPPFKVYIYEALGYKMRLSNVCKGSVWRGLGKVTGEFICDDIDKIAVFSDRLYSVNNSQPNKLAQLCLTIDEIKAYLGEKNEGYIWHISDLVIYDKPKELSEFYVEGDCDCMNCKNCAWFDKGNGHNVEDDCNLAYKGAAEHKSFKPIKRPPQSWCYVEEI